MSRQQAIRTQEAARTTARLTGAEIVWATLEGEGVREVFGYPGGAILPIYDALRKFPIRHILVRHEQGRHIWPMATRALPGGRRLHGDQRAGRDQSRHGHRDRDARLGAHRLHHRPGFDQGPGHRCLSGGGHHRHHAAHHQAQLPRHTRRRHRARDSACLPDRTLRSARSGADRHHEGCATGNRDFDFAAARLRPRAPSHAPRGIERHPQGGRTDSVGEAPDDPRRPRHHAIRRGPAGASPSPNRCRFPSPLRCSASAASPPPIN